MRERFAFYPCIAEAASRFIRIHGDGEGVLWWVSQSDLMALDRYEGVASGCYERRSCPITLVGDRVDVDANALVYVGLRTPLRETSDLDGYMSRAINAAREWGLSENTQQQLRRIAGRE